MGRAVFPMDPMFLPDRPLPQGYVLVVVDVDTVELRRPDDPKTPKNATIFRTWQDLCVIGQLDLDRTSASILDVGVVASPNAEVAAKRLWMLLSVIANDYSVKGLNYRSVKDKLGYKKKVHAILRKPTRLWFTTYAPGCDKHLDNRVRKLPGQARGLLEAMVEDGRPYFTDEQLIDVVGKKIDTCQSVWRIIHYYARRLWSIKALGVSDEINKNARWSVVFHPSSKYDILRNYLRKTE